MADDTEQFQEGKRRRAQLRADAARDVRAIADQLSTPERGMLLADVVRAVYDSEKFNGLGGEGLDARDSPARRAFQDVSNAAARAAELVETQSPAVQLDGLLNKHQES